MRTADRSVSDAPAGAATGNAFQLNRPRISHPRAKLRPQRVKKTFLHSSRASHARAKLRHF